VQQTQAHEEEDGGHDDASDEVEGAGRALTRDIIAGSPDGAALQPADDAPQDHIHDPGGQDDGERAGNLADRTGGDEPVQFVHQLHIDTTSDRR
jgi:hypothetical protein